MPAPDPVPARAVAPAELREQKPSSSEAVPRHPAAGVPKRTMLGLSPSGPAPSAAQSPAPQASPYAAANVPGKLLTPERAAESVRPKEPAAGGRSRTILGVPGVPLDAQAAAASRLADAAPSTSAHPSGQPPFAQKAASVPPVDLSPQSKRTILGAGIPIESPSTAPPAVAARPAAAEAGGSYTEPARAAAPKKAESRARSFTPVADSYGGDERSSGEDFPEPVPAGKGRLLGWLGLALAGLLLALAAYFATRSANFVARVVQVDGGDALEVEVPEAEPGTKVRFGGAELPLVAGRASFPLSADALKLGENTLSVARVAPDGSVASSEITLAVEYRVRTDLSALLSDPPAVQIAVDALPGSRLSIDGEFLALGTDGRAVKAYAVPAQAGARFELSPRYRLELPSGEAVEGTLSVSLPVASMQIDRPGADVVTDQTIIEIGGAVEPLAEVTVEGQQVEVRDGRFLHRASLPQPGDYVLRVIARASGKAPRIEELRVQRVMDLTLAAASFQADPSITYAKLMQNPQTYRGQKVAFDGRVYNVEVTGGRSVIQILALNCPSSARCPLWVDYPQATEATEDSWIRVLGTVVGEQQFKSKQGAVQTVPSVQAQYVLKLAR